MAWCGAARQVVGKAREIKELKSRLAALRTQLDKVRPAKRHWARLCAAGPRRHPY
jgi:hypothetical protein